MSATILAILIFSISIISGYSFEDNDFDIEAAEVLQNIDLFQGDILGYDNGDEYYNAVTNDNQLWTNNILYYAVDPSLGEILCFLSEAHVSGKEFKVLFLCALIASHEWLINNAITEIMNQTDNCITFKKRSTEANYLYLLNGSGCNSYVGMRRGRQDLHLGTGCFFIGTIIHELMHAIGFHHEHCRSDRDEYLDIHIENVQSGHEHAFDKLSTTQNRLLVPFDYQSIMIYGEYTFSKNKNKTMVAKSNVTIKDPYLKKSMSSLDVAAIRKLYHCDKQVNNYSL